MLTVPARAWNVYKHIFAEHWDTFRQAHARYQTPYYDELVAKMLACGNPEQMGYVEYRCLHCGQGKHVVSITSLFPVIPPLFSTLARHRARKDAGPCPPHCPQGRRDHPVRARAASTCGSQNVISIARYSLRAAKSSTWALRLRLTLAYS